jgi:hypothetical protein
MNDESLAESCLAVGLTALAVAFAVAALYLFGV